MSIDAVINESIADVTGIFTSSLHLSDDQEFKLSVKVTICKNASTMEVAKGRPRLKCYVFGVVVM